MAVHCNIQFNDENVKISNHSYQFHLFFMETSTIQQNYNLRVAKRFDEASMIETVVCPILFLINVFVNQFYSYNICLVYFITV